MTAANLIQMLLRNLDCDGTQLHAPLPPSAVHELLIIWYCDTVTHSDKDH